MTGSVGTIPVMNTATRALVAFFAPVLVVGTAVAATSVSASAAPGTVEATPASVCGALPDGDFAEYGDGSWDCYYEDIDATSQSSLAAVCAGTTEVHSLPGQRGGHLVVDDVLLRARPDQLNRYVVWPCSSPNTSTFEGRTRNTWAPPSVLPPESVSS